MSAQDIATDSTTKGAVPVPRTPKQLGDLIWSGWPFTEQLWPFHEGELRLGLPIKIEEVVENDQVVVRAELPGVDPDRDIEVTLDDGVLTIKAERREKTEEKKEQAYRTEFQYGSFVRRVRLPKGTSAEDVSAAYKDGVLEVRMPAPTSGPTARRIAVDRG